MLSIDLFCAADDQHRVKLLAEVLGDVQQALQSGQSVTLRAKPVAQPSDPCLVACTARALREPWIQALFRADHTMVAIRLDDTPLPGPCTRIVDIQTWPARSADSAVEALALSLQNLTDDGTAHTPLPAGAADPAKAADPRRAAAAHAAHAPDPRGGAMPGIGRRVRPRPGRSELKRGLMLLGLVGVGLSLLWLSAQRQAPASGESVDQRSISADQRATTTEAAAVPGASAAYAPTAGGAGPDSAGLDSSGETAGVAEGVAVSEDTLPPPPTPMPLPLPDPATAGYTDAVEHLCRAQTPAAARAWAGVLNWKQRRRAAREPCVLELLARPGFDVLEAMLDLS